MLPFLPPGSQGARSGQPVTRTPVPGRTGVVTTRDGLGGAPASGTRQRLVALRCGCVLWYSSLGTLHLNRDLAKSPDTVK